MKKTSGAAVQTDLRQEAAAIMDDDEIPVEETPAEETPREGAELTENDMPVGEEGVEYYLFPRQTFYDGKGHPGEPGNQRRITSLAVNEKPIESKSDVLKFCRSAEPGTYVLVKVMDELEVAPPKEANIVRSNPRLKKPRKAE